MVSLQKLNRDPVLASALLRLMMAINDSALADESLTMWQAVTDEKRKVRRQEAIKYFVELQIAHLYEGMKVLREISRSQALKRYIDQSDKPTRDEFARLVKFAEGNRYEELIGRVRNNLAFHYDGRLSARVLKEQVELTPDATLWISMGNSSSDWLFEPGALISEQIAVKEVFKVPVHADVTEATDKIMIEVQAIQREFVRFAGHFIWQHTHA